MPNRLFVGNLPFHATEDLLKQTFSAAGEVSSVSLVLDRQTGQSRGFAFVEMATPAAMQKAIADLNGADLGGRPLKVDVATERKQDGGGGRPHRRGGRW